MWVRVGGGGSNCGINTELPAGRVTSVAVCMRGWVCCCVLFWSLTLHFTIIMYNRQFRLTLSVCLSVCLSLSLGLSLSLSVSLSLSLSLSVTAFTNSCRFSSCFRNNLWGYPAWSVICVRACMRAPARVCVTSLWERARERERWREKERERVWDMRVGVCMCACGCVWMCGRRWCGVWVWVWRRTGWK